jgi:hypothetical protein
VGRHPSTISRELRRNAAIRSGKVEYRASVAQWKAATTARRPKTATLVEHPRLRDYVQDKLAGVLRCPDGAGIVGLDVAPWKGRASRTARTVSGPRRGVRSRSRTGQRNLCSRAAAISWTISASRSAARLDGARRPGFVVGRRSDLDPVLGQHAADRLDSVDPAVVVDEID